MIFLYFHRVKRYREGMQE